MFLPNIIEIGLQFGKLSQKNLKRWTFYWDTVCNDCHAYAWQALYNDNTVHVSRTASGDLFTRLSTKALPPDSTGGFPSPDRLFLRNPLCLNSRSARVV